MATRALEAHRSCVGSAPATHRKHIRAWRMARAARVGASSHGQREARGDVHSARGARHGRYARTWPGGCARVHGVVLASVARGRRVALRAVRMAKCASRACRDVLLVLPRCNRCCIDIAVALRCFVTVWHRTGMYWYDDGPPRCCSCIGPTLVLHWQRTRFALVSCWCYRCCVDAVAVLGTPRGRLQYRGRPSAALTLRHWAAAGGSYARGGSEKVLMRARIGPGLP